MIDSHCHLADPAFDADRDAVIARALASGVQRMVSIADTLEEAETCIAIAAAHPEVSATVGVHPHHASLWRESAINRIRTLVESSSKVCAIGEIGLDYHYNRSPPDVQRHVFNEQLRLAKHIEMPVVVHCREAVEDVWTIVQEIEPPRIVLHCCTEPWSAVERFIARGDSLSFTGIATYANAEVIRDTIRHCPLDRLMIETDAPYLTPQSLRASQKRNEPQFVTEVAKCVAAEKGMTLADVDRVTTANAVTFFGLRDS